MSLLWSLFSSYVFGSHLFIVITVGAVLFIDSQFAAVTNSWTREEFFAT